MSEMIANTHFQLVLFSGALQIEMETVRTSASGSFILMSQFMKRVLNAFNLVDKLSDSIQWNS